MLDAYQNAFPPLQEVKAGTTSTLTQEEARTVMEVIVFSWEEDFGPDWKVLLELYKKIRKDFPALATTYEGLDEEMTDRIAQEDSLLTKPNNIIKRKTNGKKQP